MSWQQELNEITTVRVELPSEGRNDGLPVVIATLRTGEELTLNESSLSFQPLPAKTAYVASVILGTAALTHLLSYWTETSPRTIADQPRICRLFLITLSLILAKVEAIQDDIVLAATNSGRRRN